MSRMFNEANDFNQSIGSWDVGKVTDMYEMFHYARSFNQDLSNWCVYQISSKPVGFESNSPLNSANLPQWGTCNSPSRISYNSGKCYKCDSVAFGTFLGPLNDSVTVVNRIMLDSIIQGGFATKNLCLSKMTDLSFLFHNNSSFNDTVSRWDLSNVTTVESMFEGATAFNQPIANWNVSNVTDMTRMFQGAVEFNQDLSQWCVVSIYTSPVGFSEYSPLLAQFEPIWGSCFNGAKLLSNGCLQCDSLSVGEYFIHKGDSIEVVDRNRLDQLIAAQGDLTKVCVSHVIDMRNVLRGQGWFNQDISSWDVSNVTNMNRMFKKASSFNQDISNWDVGNVNRMTEMFYNATAFNQDLSDWCVRAFQYNAPPNFALNGALISSHYPQWGNCPQDFDNITTLATRAFLDSKGCIDCSALNIADYFEIGGDTLLVVDRTITIL